MAGNYDRYVKSKKKKEKKKYKNGMPHGVSIKSKMTTKKTKKYKKIKKEREKHKEKTPYEKRMEARKPGRGKRGDFILFGVKDRGVDIKGMAESEKTRRQLKRFDPSLKGTDRGGYTKQFKRKGRKKALELYRSKYGR